ncbi:MAG TPA: hypothetical protein DCF33_10395 [Saprospirales bacterium]|nr:hypothetical protein [Saprospirales bacterium]
MQYHTGLENEFEDLKVAIHAYCSNVLVADNFIHNVGTGIKAVASPASPGRLQVGQEYNPLFPHKIYNVIENVSEGVVVANNVHTDIYQNKIISDYNVGSGTYAMDRGIQVTNNCPHLFLNDVTVEGFNEFGIYIDNIAAADSIFINQSLIQEPSGFSESLTPTGVWIGDAAATLVNMNGNQLTNVLRGIELLNVASPQLFFNLVTYAAKTDAGGVYNAYGIKLSNCADAIVGYNACTGNYTSGLEDVVRGVYTDHCTNFMINNNLIADAGYGLYIYETSTEGQLLCNLMDNCNVGIYLLDIGGEVGLPPLHSPMGDDDPSENHWLPEATANRFTTDEYLSNTKAQYTIWNYDNAPQAYSIPGFIAELEGSAPTLAEMDREGEACLAYSEFMGDEGGLKNSLQKLERDFSVWATAYQPDGHEFTTGSWFMHYEFWKRVHRMDFEPDDLNSDLIALYEHIRTTNIPLFFELDEALSKADHASARRLIENIHPVNDLEHYWKVTAQIYLNSFLPTGFFELSEDDERTLMDVSRLNAGLYGPAVFYAWGMLDTVMEHNKEVKASGISDIIPDVVTISPNPASDHIRLFGATGAVYEFEMYDLYGQKLFAKQNIVSGEHICLPYLANGVYLITIQHNAEVIRAEKMIVIH